MGLYPLGNIWPVGDSKTYGVTDAPGSCGPRDPMWSNLVSVSGGTFVGTLTGGSDGLGGSLSPCPISSLALAGDGHSGFHCNDITAAISGWFSSISGTPPKFGIMYAGTNDLIAIANQSPGWDINKFYTDYAAMLATTVALNTSLPWFICNMDLMPALLTAVPAQLQQANAFINATVKQYQRQGSLMYLIDLAGAAITYNSGGIHQDVAGYAATSARMVAVIKTLRPAG